MIEYSVNIKNCLKYATEFVVFKDGSKREIREENLNFNLIYFNVENLFNYARVMPAFGVSLHGETLNALKTEEWLQINFSKELEVNGLNFTALLFRLENTSGVNLIRLYNSKYDGRCIYLDFEEEKDLHLILNTLDNPRKIS